MYTVNNTCKNAVVLGPLGKTAVILPHVRSHGKNAIKRGSINVLSSEQTRELYVQAVDGYYG